MKPENIYALTRIDNLQQIQKLERQMSERAYFISVKNWEIKCLRKLANELYEHFNSIDKLKFYYSFQIPKLGKEFDLLKITNDYVINIELKSEPVSEERIKRQLLRNKYYLSSLGKIIRSYSYVSSEEKLYRLTKSENLIETDWQHLIEDLNKTANEYTDNIEELFKEENYIISPLTDPERFLRHEYFLTSQQNDIRNNIIKNVKENTLSYQGFTGLPGTGKTLLLYDLALELSFRQKVCVMHFGSFPGELEYLNNRLKRIDFINCNSEDNYKLENYKAILIDEGHRITKQHINNICCYAKKMRIPVIFSYDNEDAISINERESDSSNLIESLPNFIKYKLTNRIRMNSELSSFINCLHMPSKYRWRKEYPNVKLYYAADNMEGEALLNNCISNGYIYIKDPYADNAKKTYPNEICASLATCREFEKLVMIIDDSFNYDEDKCLRCICQYKSRVSLLFHGLNRAKKSIALIVINNIEVFETILDIIQKS